VIELPQLWLPESPWHRQPRFPVRRYIQKMGTAKCCCSTTPSDCTDCNWPDTLDVTISGFSACSAVNDVFTLDAQNRPAWPGAGECAYRLGSLSLCSFYNAIEIVLTLYTVHLYIMAPGDITYSYCCRFGLPNGCNIDGISLSTPSRCIGTYYSYDSGVGLDIDY